MKDIFASPFFQKMCYLGASVGIYVLAHKFPDIKDYLLVLAGTPVGGALLARPGDVTLTPIRNAPPPPPIQDGAL